MMELHKNSAKPHTQPQYRVVNGGGAPHRLQRKKNRGGAIGQEVMEFAIVFPLLILFVFGVLDLGRLFHALITITNAAREGARYGMIHSELADFYSIRTVARDEALASGIPLTIDNVDDPVCSDGNSDAMCDRGQPIIVTVRYDFTPLMTGFLSDSTLELVRSAEMMVP